MFNEPALSVYSCEHFHYYVDVSGVAPTESDGWVSVFFADDPSHTDFGFRGEPGAFVYESYEVDFVGNCEWVDTFVGVWVTANDPGYDSGHPKDPPGGPISDELPAPPICDDSIATVIVNEYKDYNANEATPSCAELSSDGGGSTHYSHNTLVQAHAGHDHRKPGESGRWGIVADGVADGLEYIRTEWGTELSVTSGYRCPGGNAGISPKGGRLSRHIYGDAVDFLPSSGGWNETIRNQLVQLATVGSGHPFVWAEPWGTGSGQTTSHVHVQQIAHSSEQDD